MVQTSGNMFDQGVALGYIMQSKEKLKLAPLRRYSRESAENPLKGVASLWHCYFLTPRLRHCVHIAYFSDRKLLSRDTSQGFYDNKSQTSSAPLPFIYLFGLLCISFSLF